VLSRPSKFAVVTSGVATTTSIRRFGRAERIIITSTGSTVGERAVFSIRGCCLAHSSRMYGLIFVEIGTG
jgi:hypothetical protein